MTGVTHIAAAGFHGEQRCARCHRILFRESDVVIELADWTRDSWTYYPYRLGDRVVQGSNWQALALSAAVPQLCEVPMSELFTITPIPDLTRIPDDAHCQEASPFSTEKYIPCFGPAIAIVQHIGRSEGPYYMCAGCADHNVRHRHAKVVLWKPGHEHNP